MNRTIYNGEVPAGWRVCFLDFETYYEGKYGLRKLTTEEYVRDERFQALCCAVLWDDDEEIEVLKSAEIADYLAKIDWTKTVLVAHNASFDAFILTEHYGHRPARIVDTMSLARCLFPNQLDQTEGKQHGYSLNALAKTLLHVPGKSRDVSAAEGLDLAHFEANPDAYDSLMRYCAQDTFLLRDLYQFLLKTGRVDKVELSCIDGMIRATTDPTLYLDAEIVDAYADERESFFEEHAGLAKDQTFAEALRELGIEPQTKMGARGELFCFAKSDPFMQELLAEGSDEVKSLVETRLLVNSTVERTRARRFANIAKRGPLPAFLLPNGTHTGRDSGSEKQNLQNIQRGSPLRRAIMAGEGRTLIVADASQIECRVLNWWAGEEWVKDVFTSGGKIYIESGENMFHRPVVKLDDEGNTTDIYQAAKETELSCGYRTGPDSLQTKLKSRGVELDIEACGECVRGYRDTHPSVVALWKRLDKLIERMAVATPEWRKVMLGDLPFHFGKDSLRLPSGRRLVYPNLRYDQTDRSWKYDRLIGRRAVEKYVHGGPITNNVTQAMARDIAWEADARIRAKWERYGLRLALRVHDELVYSVPKAIADAVFASVCEEMSAAPSWLPDIVLETEGAVADRWGDAK